MDLPLQVVTLSLSSCVFIFALSKLRRSRSSTPLPPGPPGLPIVGNALQVPPERQWLTFAEWAKQYGDIIHISIFGKSTIVLSSPKAILDILDRRSAMYADRPRLVVGGEMVGYARLLPLSPYSNRHRQGRRILSPALTAKEVQAGAHEHEFHSRKLLFSLLTSPNEFRTHLRYFIASVVFMLALGHKIEGLEDSFLQLAEEANTNFSLITAPGAFFADLFPILSWLPAWFPGGGFKKTAKACRTTLDRMLDEPYEAVRKQLAEGVAYPSFAANLLRDNLHPDAETDDLNKCTAGIFYIAGADTTVSGIETFFLAMSLFPDAQRKAQAELDAVLGPNGLPTFSDRAKLPYINALIKEVYRWHPITPLAVPHKAEEDFVYEGLLIPAGCSVIPNVWAVLHDPSVYPDPFTFSPERFLTAQASEDVNPDPQLFAFGFGRRACPGMLLADASVFMVVARTLAAFNIAKAKDDHGRPIEPNVEYTGMISHASYFGCTIIPRTSEMARLIKTFGGDE